LLREKVGLVTPMRTVDMAVVDMAVAPLAVVVALVKY
jgi:hypothetical protein